MRGVSDGVTILSSQAYSPYGEPLSPDLPTDFGFTGEMTDSANDLVYLRARVMNPRLGIFGSLDPFEGESSSPLTMNGYSWVEGNTPNLTDASGMASCNLTSLSLSANQPLISGACVIYNSNMAFVSRDTACSGGSTFNPSSNGSGRSVRGVGSWVSSVPSRIFSAMKSLARITTSVTTPSATTYGAGGVYAIGGSSSLALNPTTALSSDASVTQDAGNSQTVTVERGRCSQQQYEQLRIRKEENCKEKDIDLECKGINTKDPLQIKTECAANLERGGKFVMCINARRDIHQTCFENLDMSGLTQEQRLDLNLAIRTHQKTMRDYSNGLKNCGKMIERFCRSHYKVPREWGV